MPEHVNEWLGAYSDGELHGARLRQVESHLGQCPQCRAELEQLTSLSSMLREAEAVGDFMSTERFVSELNLNLPRRSEIHQTRKALEIGWWLIPFGVMSLWAFLQVTFALSTVAMNISNSGLLGNAFAWLQSGPTQTEWFSALMNVLGNQLGANGQTVLFGLNNADLFIEGLLGQLILQAFLAVIYLGWLASWWFMRSNPSSNPGSMEIQAQ